MTPSLPVVPRLYIWSKRSLYLGAHYVPEREYTVSWDQLVVCLEGEVILKLAEGSHRACRSILLRAGTTVPIEDIDTSKATLAVCYLNPIGQDYMALQTMMCGEVKGMHIDHATEAELVEQLLYVRNARLSSKQAYEKVESLVFPPHLAGREFRQFDERIITVVHTIKATVRDNLSVGRLAAEVHLSESRLVKLFKQQIGVPITKHRIGYRVFVGIVHLAVGYSITEAALAAGFASTAHFSKCFRASIGTQPSATFLSPPYLEVILADECLKAIAD